MLQRFHFYPVISVAIPNGKLIFEFKQSLGKMLTALNWRGWEIKPSKILIGVHIVSCFIFPSKYWALWLYSWKWEFEFSFLVQNAFFDLLEWELCVSFCGQFQLSEEPSGRFTSSFSAVGHRLPLLAVLVWESEVPKQEFSFGKGIQIKDSFWKSFIRMVWLADHGLHFRWEVVLLELSPPQKN